MDEKIRQNSIKMAEELAEKEISFQQNKPMALVTTFSIGGPTPLYIEPKNASQMIKTIALLKKYQLPFYVLGRGSNVLFPDGEFPGGVVHIGKDYAKMEKLETGRFYAQSGALLTDFAAFVGDSGYTGAEFAYGIPGSVGGGVYMNAGAYDGELKDILSKVTYATLDGQIKTLERTPSNQPDKEFSYRKSFFTDQPFIILEVVVCVTAGNRVAIHEKMEKLMSARREKQPLELPSAGSVFKRPVKGYASALIDDCGLKGTQIGGAQISKKHAGFIVNQGNATAADVQNLIAKVQEVVFEQTGILLECELKTAEPMNPW